MDKKLNYEKAILTMLEEYAQFKPANWRSAEQQIIADREHGHFQLVRLGWLDGQRVHNTIFHFDLVGEKVWVQENRTDLPIVDELEFYGIAPDDVVDASWGPVPEEALALAA